MRWSRLSFRIAKKLLFLASSRLLVGSITHHIVREHRDDVPTVVVNGGEKRRSRRSSGMLAPSSAGAHEYHSDSEVHDSNNGNQSPRSPDLNNSPPELDESGSNYDSFKRATLGKYQSLSK